MSASSASEQNNTLLASSHSVAPGSAINACVQSARVSLAIRSADVIGAVTPYTTEPAIQTTACILRDCCVKRSKLGGISERPCLVRRASCVSMRQTPGVVA